MIFFRSLTIYFSVSPFRFEDAKRALDIFMVHDILIKLNCKKKTLPFCPLSTLPFRIIKVKLRWWRFEIKVGKPSRRKWSSMRKKRKLFATREAHYSFLTHKTKNFKEILNNNINVYHLRLPTFCRMFSPRSNVAGYKHFNYLLYSLAGLFPATQWWVN